MEAPGVRLPDGRIWRLSRRGLVLEDYKGARVVILDFCLDHPDQGPVVTLPIFPVGVT